MITLGAKVKDTVTGFEGIAAGRAEYLGDKREILIQPVCHNNIYPEPMWIPEGRIESKFEKSKKAGF